ncbi:hypothetical protein KAU43_05090 [candidate division WOR-3 bacterium]|nr:hypothetical protein [candidate division WOR-3 bacterium]
MKDKSLKSMDEITWSNFKQTCLDIGLRQFDTIGNAWQEFKDMMEGKIHIFGDHMLRDEYWKCELRYDFMDFEFAKELLNELNVPEPKPLPPLNKKKLFDYWKSKIPEHKKTYFENASPNAIWTEDTYYRHWVQRNFKKDEIILITVPTHEPFPKTRKSDEMLDFLESQGLDGGVAKMGRGSFKWLLLKTIEKKEYPESNITETIAEGYSNHPQSAWTKVKEAYAEYVKIKKGDE